MASNLIEPTPSAYGYPLLIKHLLHTPLAHAPDQQIVYRGEHRYTYRELKARIGCLANALAKLGVRSGTTVAVMDWDSHRYLECYFAVPMMGAVLQMVNVRLSPEQILYTLNHAGADMILVHHEFVALLEGIWERLTTAKKFVLLRDGAELEPISIPFEGEYEALLSTASSHFDFPDFDENTRATTFYTTGTTGLPKGVAFSHRQLVLHTLATMAQLGANVSGQRFHRGDVYMPVAPMFHVHCWGMPYVATLLGVKQVYAGRYLPERLLELIQQEGVTFSHCVATVLHMVLTAPLAKGVDLSKWKVLIGGGPLPRGLAQAALDRGIDVFAAYGMSETCPFLTVAQIKPSPQVSREEELRLRCKAGLPWPLVDLRVVDENMSEVPHDGNSTGEVVARAPWATQSYLNDWQASEQLWAGGYLHSQDIGNIDEDGHLQITDRVKDVIKSGGEWISSLEIEDLISRHPKVSEVAVFAVKDEKWGERPMALVVPKLAYANAITADEIRAHVMHYAEKGTISRYAVPERILIVEAIDKTSVGKMNKKLLREKYGAG